MAAAEAHAGLAPVISMFVPNPAPVTILAVGRGISSIAECVVRNDEYRDRNPDSPIFVNFVASMYSAITPLCGSGNPGSNPGGGTLCCTHGLVGYDARFTRARSRVRSSVGVGVKGMVA